MPEKKQLRLPVVAKEFNVGVSTIVDHLKDQGFEVNPRTRITEEMYKALQVAFQKDADIKEKAEQINLGKTNREDVVLRSSPAAKKQATRKEDEQDVVIIKTGGTTQKIGDKAPPKKEEEPEVKKEEPAAEKPKLDGPKIVGKVELEKPKPPKKEEEPEVKKEEPATKKEEPVTKKEEEPVAKKETKPKPPEKEEFEFKKTEKIQLGGPKIVGKIDLSTRENRPKSDSKDKEGDKSKKEGASGGDEPQRKKRRRKRVVKPERISLKDKKQGDRSGKKKQQPDQPQVSEKEIEDKIKDTLAKLSGGAKGKGAKAKIKKQKLERLQANQGEEEVDSSILQVTEFISVSELASLMGVSATEVISKCLQLGIIVSINQRLDAEVIELVADEFDFTVKFTDVTEEDEEEEEEIIDDPADLEERAPIITVMGHVDHGKTSLLDHIRDANVADKEAGGITQHIGAYEVLNEDGKKLVFLDTPGHEAFTAMRARGAKVTDVAVIVIAADDQVMPQTKEAISHAQAAGVPMVFAINKMDKDGANPDKIKEQLANMNLLVEDWGGNFQSQEISAKMGTNIDKLLEKILLESELLELKANPGRPAQGTVIEAMLDKGRGYVTTILVNNGTLKVGDSVVSGTNYGKVKAMFNEKGGNLKEAGPSTAVQILGLDGAPQAGEVLKVYESDSDAKALINKRKQILREQGLRTKKHITLDEIGRRLALGNFKELNVIIKGDVDGSVEALADSLLKLSTEEVQVNVVHRAVGQITESDVLLASASDAVIIGFQVRPSSSARRLADKENIEIRMYSIIYDAIEEVKTAMEGMLEPKIEETVTGMLEILETFKISRVGTIAGCLATEGKIYAKSKVRLIRDGIVVYTGELESLRRVKEDVKDVAAGMECGAKIKDYNDIKVGDFIEAYTEKEVKRKLK